MRDALIGHYYRLLDGEHAGRIVIYAGERLDGQKIVRFANGLTWSYLEKIIDARCEVASPTFPPPRQTPDYGRASWYADSGEGPLHHEW